MKGLILILDLILRKKVVKYSFEGILYSFLNVYSDGEMLFIFERIVYPIIKEFKPDMIFISAGFDGCEGDPLGNIIFNPIRQMLFNFLSIFILFRTT